MYSISLCCALIAAGEAAHDAHALPDHDTVFAIYKAVEAEWQTADQMWNIAPSYTTYQHRCAHKRCLALWNAAWYVTCPTTDPVSRRHWLSEFRRIQKELTP